MKDLMLTTYMLWETEHFPSKLENKVRINFSSLLFSVLLELLTSKVRLRKGGRKYIDWKGTKKTAFIHTRHFLYRKPPKIYQNIPGNNKQI